MPLTAIAELCLPWPILKYKNDMLLEWTNFFFKLVTFNLQRTF